MNKEFSAGAVIFSKRRSQSFFLLVCGRKSERWGFPKGHIEEGESEKEAALREISEETGLDDLRIVDGFREEVVYKTISNRVPFEGQMVEKHVTFFLCETKNEKVTVDREEISDFKWKYYQEAEKLLTFEVLKEVLRKAEQYSHMDIPKDGRWQKVAIGHQLDRYMLDIADYGLPYYEVRWIDLCGDDHEVHFVVPGDYIGIDPTPIIKAIYG